MNNENLNLKINEWRERFSCENRNDKFCINDEGEFCKIKDQQIIPISNFFWIPLEKIMKISEEGIKEDYKYVFAGVVNNVRNMKIIEVPVNVLGGFNWFKKWDIYCRIYGNAKANYTVFSDFLFEVENEIPERIVYDTIGWHQFENQWFFLHSGGVIGDTKNNVSTSKNKFFFKTNDSLDGKNSYLKTLDLLDISNHSLTYPLLSFVLTSIITTPLNKKGLSPDYLMWIVGNTGLGKTTFSTFFTNIYKKNNVSRPEVHKTGVLLPELIDHKDCVFIIDDYGTAKSSHIEKAVNDKIESFVRDVGDRQVSIQKISNGMVLIAGEKFLAQNDKNESSIGRIIRLKMEKFLSWEDEKTTDDQKRANRKKYKEHIKQQSLPTSIFYYLKWLSEKLNSNFIENYKESFDDLRLELGIKYKSHARYVDATIHQIIAFNTYMSYGVEKEFISTEYQIKMCNYAKELFCELLVEQSTIMYDKNIELFFNALIDLILDDTIVVVIDGDRLNINRKIYGVVIEEKKQRVLKLDWDDVYGMVSQHIFLSKRNGIPFIGPKVLARLFNENHLICFNENGTTTLFPTSIGIKKCRVINFRASMIPSVIEAIEQRKKETEVTESERLAKGFKELDELNEQKKR